MQVDAEALSRLHAEMSDEQFSRIHRSDLNEAAKEIYDREVLRRERNKILDDSPAAARQGGNEAPRKRGRKPLLAVFGWFLIVIAFFGDLANLTKKPEPTYGDKLDRALEATSQPLDRVTTIIGAILFIGLGVVLVVQPNSTKHNEQRG